MPSLGDLDWIAVVVSTLVAGGLGAAWYSPVLFGPAWMAALGKSEEDLGPTGAAMAGSVFSCFVAAVSVGLLLQGLGVDSLLGGLGVGALVGLGIVAMTMGAAQLMIRYGVTCNVLMPRASTDMTMQGPTAAMFQAPEEGFHHFDPANVAPLVTYLASPRAGHISGEVFIAWGNQVQVVKRPEPLPAHVNPEGEAKWTLGALDESLSTYFDENHAPVRDGFSLPIG